jgi:hypothetical protein
MKAAFYSIFLIPLLAAPSMAESIVSCPPTSAIYEGVSRHDIRLIFKDQTPSMGTKGVLLDKSGGHAVEIPFTTEIGNGLALETMTLLVAGADVSSLVMRYNSDFTPSSSDLDKKSLAAPFIITPDLLQEMYYARMHDPKIPQTYPDVTWRLVGCDKAR